MSDPEIERLEADLRRSRLEKWDVETYLANRHRAKIEELTNPASGRVSLWRLFREITDPLVLYVGWIALLNLFVFWLMGVNPFR